MKRVQSIAAMTVLALGASAFGGPVTVDFSSTQSHKGLGSFTGTAVYDDTTDELTLDIVNTSKGALTAFAFDVEKGDAARYERPKGAPWKDERNHKGIINAKPYGKYGGGAAVHGTWGSTGVKRGIASDQRGVFIFDVTDPNASTLSTTDFFNNTSPEIVATFAGFKHHKTDRASGFGSAVIPTTITSPTGGVLGSTTPGGNAPILKVLPPVVIVTPPGGNTLPPIGGSSGPSAVPLPAAAPAGLGMLALFALVRFARRVRSIIA